MVHKILKLSLSLLICHSAGFIGSIFTRSSVSTWYKTINKPSFTPPSWIFAPVWLTLYTLMGVSFFIIWEKGWQNNNVRNALIVFTIHLIVNALWSFAFFGMRSPIFGLMVILVLVILILYAMYLFYPISKLSFYLLIPYILWTTFAAFLNLSFVILNK
ncbi:MAG: tryptophan-rich sensory protein [Endomicrobiales bacterium]|nr:tryptophan-rich sensory protein [Endomicrobiales bacterium]